MDVKKVIKNDVKLMSKRTSKTLSKIGTVRKYGSVYFPKPEVSLIFFTFLLLIII